MESCPCSSGKNYDECCQLLHDGGQAKTAEALMRARYSAFVKVKVPFILGSVHPDKRPDHDEKTIRSWATNSDWKGLEIVETAGGMSGDEEGMVEFIASFTEKGRLAKHHERAQFKKEGDDWFFHDGTIVKAQTFVREAPKVGRNDPCPCGSGKKYKKCCAKA